jgi:hypothetical protein
MEENAYAGVDVPNKGKKAPLPQASEFLRRVFGLVAPGGISVNGNMILDRTQLDFVFGVVDWPIINARSESQILRIYERAGILNNPNADFKMFRVQDAIAGVHLYNIMVAQKLS